MDVILDTSSDWLAIEGAGCESCLGNTFDTAASTSAKSIGLTSSERRYGDIVVTGREWSDKVCLTSDICVTDFSLFLIESQVFMKEPVDGFLGLAREEPFISGKFASMNYKRGASILKAMTDAGKISQRTFSLYLSSGDQDNYIHFGEP